MGDKPFNGRIYKLYDDINTHLYIGVTDMFLEERLLYHKDNRCKLHSINTTYNIDWNNVRIDLIELYKYKKYEELQKRSKYWIDKVNPLLNKCMKENNNEKAKLYYQNNKDKVKEYREANKDKIEEQRSQPWLCDLCNYQVSETRQKVKTL